MGSSRLLVTLGYLGCSFSVGVFNAFNNFTLSLWLAGFTSSYLLLGLLGNSKSLEGAIVSPIFGTLSDRTWLGWLGRRRPFILVGGLSAALLLALTPHIGRLPFPVPLGGLPADLAGLASTIVAVFLFTLAFNTMDDIHKALLPDLTTGAARNRLSSLSVVVDMAGQVGLLTLGFFLWSTGVPDSAFALAGALMACGVLLTVLLVREPDPETWRAASAAELPELVDTPEPVRSKPQAKPAEVISTLLTRYRGAF